MKKLILGLSAAVSYLLFSKIKFGSRNPTELTPSELANDVIDNLSKARKLYKQLIVKIHPDNFQSNPELQQRALDISSRVTENKKNYAALKKLEEEVYSINKLKNG
jgi:hypothetical protein